jgi:DNA-binding NarL/FixJ family response regulator
MLRVLVACHVETFHCATTAEDALLVFSKFTPSNVLLDIDSFGGDGIKLVKLLKLSIPEVFIVVITDCDTNTSAIQLFDGGVGGVLNRSSSCRELSHQIEGWLMNIVPIATPVVQLLFKASLSKPSYLINSCDTFLIPGFSCRENEIMGHMIGGKNVKAMAGLLGVAPSTVTSHIKNIVTTRPQFLQPKPSEWRSWDSHPCKPWFAGNW